MRNSYPIPRRDNLTLGEVLELCQTHGITSDLPYSQFEAEAVLRGVSLLDVVKAYLLAKLEEVGTAP